MNIIYNNYWLKLTHIRNMMFEKVYILDGIPGFFSLDNFLKIDEKIIGGQRMHQGNAESWQRFPRDDAVVFYDQDDGCTDYQSLYEFIENLALPPSSILFSDDLEGFEPIQGVKVDFSKLFKSSLGSSLDAQFQAEEDYNSSSSYESSYQDRYTPSSPYDYDFNPYESDDPLIQFEYMVGFADEEVSFSVSNHSRTLKRNVFQNSVRDDEIMCSLHNGWTEHSGYADHPSTSMSADFVDVKISPKKNVETIPDKYKGIKISPRKRRINYDNSENQSFCPREALRPREEVSFTIWPRQRHSDAVVGTFSCSEEEDKQVQYRIDKVPDSDYSDTLSDVCIVLAKPYSDIVSWFEKVKRHNIEGALQFFSLVSRYGCSFPSEDLSYFKLVDQRWVDFPDVLKEPDLSFLKRELFFEVDDAVSFHTQRSDFLAFSSDCNRRLNYFLDVRAVLSRFPLRSLTSQERIDVSNAVSSRICDPISPLFDGRLLVQLVFEIVSQTHLLRMIDKEFSKVYLPLWDSPSSFDFMFRNYVFGFQSVVPPLVLAYFNSPSSSKTLRLRYSESRRKYRSFFFPPPLSCRDLFCYPCRFRKRPFSFSEIQKFLDQKDLFLRV